jgi:S1-C subfamily serine protease
MFQDKYLIVFASLISVSAVPAWSQINFGNQECAIVAASRASLPEARQWIIQNDFEEVAVVFRSSNGWFAITVGVVPKSRARGIIENGVRVGALPPDAYCSTGTKYVAQVNWKRATASPAPSSDLWTKFDARPLSVSEKRFLQAGLALQGYYSGLLDGVWGQGSQASFEAYTKSEFGREPFNADAAALTVYLLMEIENDGWSQRLMEGLAMGVILPISKMRITNENGLEKTWTHTEKDLTLITDDLTTTSMRAIHARIEAGTTESEAYTVRKNNRWVTSTKTYGRTNYIRSDLIRGTWSTIFVSSDAASKSDLNLVVSSISQVKIEDFIPSESAVLLRNAKLLLEEMNDEGGGPSSSGEVGASTAPQNTPATPEEPRAGGTGTGFVINDESVLLTNAHVVEECSSITVNGHRADLLVSSNIFDLAAVSVPNVFLGEPLKFSSEAAGLNADITIAGYPLHGLLGGLNVSRGSISALKGLRGDEANLQISAPVQPGNSGGPAVNRFGNVVGVVVSKLDTVEIADLTGDIAQNINFAVRGDLAKVFLSSNGIPYSEASEGVPIGAEKIAQRLQSSTHLIECLRH